MKTTAKRREFVKISDCIVVPEKNERMMRMESYVRDTHLSFLNSLKIAEQMQILGNGALAGPAIKRVGATR
jgi:hypothetical protein